MKKTVLLKSIAIFMASVSLMGCGKNVTEDTTDVSEPAFDASDVSMESADDTLIIEDTTSEDVQPEDVSVSDDSVSDDSISENEAEEPAPEETVFVPAASEEVVISKTGPATITIMNACGYDLSSVLFSFEGLTAAGIKVNGDKKLKDGSSVVFSLEDADIYRPYLPIKITVTGEVKGKDSLTFPTVTVLGLDDLTVLLTTYNGELQVETE